MNKIRQCGKNSKGKLIAYPSVIGLALVGLIHSELWIIAIVALLGPIRALLVLAIVLTLLANGIILALETKTNVWFIERMRSRVLDRQERGNSLFKRIVNVSRIAGILAVAILVGALTAAFLIHALGYKRPGNYLLATAGSFLFTLTWVAIYSGAIAVIKQFLNML